MRRLVAALALALLGLGLVAGPASAAERLTIRRIDTSAFPKVKLLGLVGGTDTPPAGAFEVKENGKAVTGVTATPIGDTSQPFGTVLAVDMSSTMNKFGALDQVKVALHQFVAQKKANEQIAIVAFNDAPRTVVNFTTDATELHNGIDRLSAIGETALWDGARVALGLFAERPELLPNVIVLADSADNRSTTTYDSLKNAALAAKAAVFTIGLKANDLDAGTLRDLAGTTGGQYLEAGDPKALTAALASAQQAVGKQYEISYTSSVHEGNIDLEVSVAGATAKVKSIATDARGVVTPPKLVDDNIPSPLRSSWTPWLVALLVIGAVAMFVYAVILLFVRDGASVERTLRPYTEGVPAGGDDEGREVSLVESALVQRAVKATADIARERGILQKVEAALEKADLPLQPPEALFFYLVAVVVLSATALLLGNLFTFAIVAVLTALIPPATLVFLAERRQRKFTSQLPDTLTLLAGTLRAGYSLLQGVEAVAQEVEDPMGRELRRVLAEARLGRPLEDALEDCAERMESPDFEWAVMAIRIQREVGGNLAELLDTVAETMLQRERLRREIRALTAEGRISAIILGLLPVGLGVVMWTLNPDYMHPLFHKSLGQAMLIGSIVLAFIGFYWMKKTIEIEV